MPEPIPVLSATTEQMAEQSSTPRLRLEFLDGLRGLAALYVTLHHACIMMTTQTGYSLFWKYDDQAFPWALQQFFHCFEMGRYSVILFIVLSGYCLMLPVVRSAGGTLKGGVQGYFARRARRILPPYYAALGLSLLLMALAYGVKYDAPPSMYSQLPAFTPGVIVSHLLLIHNLKVDWEFKINGPLWSVATEWQIYFVFAFVLLPVWRRFGLVAAVAAGFVVGLLPHFVLHRLDMAAPWFIGLFALGMAGAVLTFSPDANYQRWRTRLPWGWMTLVGSGALFYGLLHPYGIGGREWQMDTLGGLISLCLILWLAQSALRPSVQKPVGLRLLESRLPVTLGLFSYSLYLTHAPLEDVIRHILLPRLGLGVRADMAIMLLVAVPFCVVAAYLFHLAFERRFMSAPQRKSPQTKEA